MAETETGWTKEFPAVREVRDLYWIRKGEQLTILQVNPSGKHQVLGVAVSYLSGELREWEFLGPISPSDFEQLTRLREAVSALLENNGGPTTSIHGEYVLVRREDFEALAQRHTGGEQA